MPHTATLPLLLKQLKLSTMARHWEALLPQAREKGWNGAEYLAVLCEQELAERYSRRIARDQETQVLFELIAHRYETGSLVVTSNQPFAEWDRIFPDQMMTVAAVDRLIHHASLIEIGGDSYRRKEALRQAAGHPTSTTSAPATTTPAGPPPPMRDSNPRQPPPM
jgi:DNA replication protein DnaC